MNDNLLTKFSKEYILDVIGLVKERAVFESEILEEGAPFFTDEVHFNMSAVDKKWNTELVPNLLLLCAQLFEIEEFISSNIEACFHDYIKSSGISFGKIMPIMRIAITGNLAGPSMFDSLELIGKEKMKQRVTFAIDKLK